MSKCGKNNVKVGVGKIKKKHVLYFFQMLAQFLSSCAAIRT